MASSSSGPRSNSPSDIELSQSEDSPRWCRGDRRSPSTDTVVAAAAGLRKLSIDQSEESELTPEDADLRWENGELVDRLLVDLPEPPDMNRTRLRIPCRRESRAVIHSIFRRACCRNNPMIRRSRRAATIPVHRGSRSL